MSSSGVPGEPGLWVFLLGDMAIFAIMFVAFLFDRAKDPELYLMSRESLDLTIGLTNTMVLLTSSLIVVIALRNVRATAFGRATWAFAGAALCAVVFTALKAVEYTHLVQEGHGPDSNPYFMWLFILTGVHLAHVALGFVVLVVLMLRARRRIRSEGSGRVFYEGGTCYWHLVDLLWMMLFPLVYLVA
ncbi:cytochrome c oxidase subunit 3 family protein [Gordonia sp. HNM0687]|uniref:Cytochrome aa3 subunit 3 n=2 Tax=Gordonia mangrovi TaxID=2665643 RepID=A0A6L7GTR4_9ACTN|nr:cytochrome c oxidase subunit 3 family protein [Gordonia mangrovi]UVF80761.1 cytochrome c oxidase subunit 3 [Gordonia mangrovi]